MRGGFLLPFAGFLALGLSRAITIDNGSQSNPSVGAANFTSKSNIVAPIIPGQDPPITISRVSPQEQSIPAGRLGHHLLTVITSFWEMNNNFAYHIRLECRDEHFRDILTLISPNPDTQRVTPQNIAWSLNRIALNTFHVGNWRALKFDWAYAQSPMGTIEIFISPTNLESSNASQLQLNVESIRDGAHIANAPSARTYFTGIPTTPEDFLRLFQKLMAAIWSVEADAPVAATFPTGGCLRVDLLDPSDDLKLDLCVEDLRSDPDVIVWKDITDRLLIALQLPAYLDRWETVHSDFFMGSQNKIASVDIFRQPESQHSYVRPSANGTTVLTSR